MTPYYPILLGDPIIVICVRDWCDVDLLVVVFLVVCLTIVIYTFVLVACCLFLWIQTCLLIITIYYPSSERTNCP